MESRLNWSLQMTVYYLGKEKTLTQIITVTPPPGPLKWEMEYNINFTKLYPVYFMLINHPLGFPTKINMHFEQHIWGSLKWQPPHSTHEVTKAQREDES